MSGCRLSPAGGRNMFWAGDRTAGNTNHERGAFLSPPGPRMESDHSCRVATGADDGKPLVFRIRNEPPPFAQKKKAFPHLLAVGWQYDSPNEQGMPSEDVVARMGALEDLLTEAFEGARQAFLTVVVTGNGVREWQW